MIKKKEKKKIRREKKKRKKRKAQPCIRNKRRGEGKGNREKRER
jgi:hypothetical protein